MDKLLYGMPTLIECDSLDQCVSLCEELNLDFIEINMNLPQYQRNTIDIKKLKEIITNKNIFFAIHLDENLNVCDFNKEIAKVYINEVLFAIEIAKKLKIPILNMHMSKGVYFTLPDRKIYLFEKHKDFYLKELINFRDICTKAIGKYDIKICVENCDGYRDFMKEGIDLLLESDAFALTWDIGHDHGIGNKDTKYICKKLNRVKHMHIHDAIGTKNHLPLGTGEIDINDKFKIAKENNCTCVLETKTIEGLKKSVKYINNLI